MSAPAPLPDHGHGWGSERWVRTVDGAVVDSEVAVYPLADVVPHVVPGSECWCGPASEFPDVGCIIYTHHSLDGRELSERATPEGSS